MMYKSVEDMSSAIRAAIPRIPSDVDVVAGLPRSGMLAASLCALQLNVALADLDGFLEGRLLACGGSGRPVGRVSNARDCKHLLVVDDSVWSGAAMRNAREKVRNADVSARVTYAAVFVAPEQQDAVDIAMAVCPMPRVFEWNLFHHGTLRHSCVDIDGVLCPDPTDAENDDGAAYQRFVAKAPLLVRPTARIGWLVTCRLEKYREATEEWLRRKGVEYDHLLMMDLPSLKERQRLGNHARFKAEQYVRTGAVLFVESDARQARDIARLASRPVLCASTWSMEYPPPLRLARLAARRLPSTCRWYARFYASRLGRCLLQYVGRGGGHG